MEVYLTATSISLMFALLAKKIKKDIISNNYSLEKNRFGLLFVKVALLYSFIPIFLVSAFRYNVGTDYAYRYVPGFNRILNGGEETFEIGYMLLNKIAAGFSKDYVSIFIITSFIFCLFIYLSIREQSDDFAYSMLMLVFSTFYFASLNIVRQSISIAIFLYSIKYIRQKKFALYLLFILLAFSFHSTAIICIPIYFLGKYISKMKQIISLAICCLSVPCMNFIMTYITQLTKYSKYIGSKYDTQNFYIASFIIECIVLLFYYAIVKHRKESNDNIYINIQFICVIATIFSPIIPNAYRIIYYFQFAKILYLPRVFNEIKNNNLKYLSKYSILILYFLYMIYKIVLGGAHQVIPYQSVFVR